MKIENKNDGARGAFTAVDDSKLAGEMTYVFANPQLFIIDHTNVEPAYAGRGVGTEMVLAAVDYARGNELQIMPTCPFARSVFMKRDDIRDVLFR